MTPVPSYRTTFVSREYAFALGIEDGADAPFLSIPTSFGVADSSEEYRLTREQYTRFSADPVQALDLVEDCIARRNDDALIPSHSGKGRGAAAALAGRPDTPRLPIITSWLADGRHPTLRLYDADGLRGDPRPESRPLVADIGGGIFVGVDVVDAHGGRRAVTEADADQGRVTGRELIDETRARVIGYRFDAVENPNGSPRVIADEAYAAARLLDGTQASASASPFGKTAPITFVLARECVVQFVDRQVNGRDLAEEGTRAALGRRAALRDAGAPLLKSDPITWRDGSWQPYDWRTAHPGLVDEDERSCAEHGGATRSM